MQTLLLTLILGFTAGSLNAANNQKSDVQKSSAQKSRVLLPHVQMARMCEKFNYFEAFSIEELNQVSKVKFSEEGTELMAIGQPSSLPRIFNTETGKRVSAPFKLDKYTELTDAWFSSKKKEMIFDQGEKKIASWNYNTHSPISQSNGRIHRGIAFSQNGESAAIDGEFDKTILIISTKEEKEPIRVHVPEAVSRFYFSKTEPYLIAILSEETLSIIDSKTGKVIKNIKVQGGANSAEVSQDGKKLVTANDSGILRIIKIKTAQILTEVNYGDEIKILGFADKGNQVAILMNETLFFIDANTGQKLNKYEIGQSVIEATVSPDGYTVAIGVDDGPLLIVQQGEGCVDRVAVEFTHQPISQNTRDLCEKNRQQSKNAPPHLEMPKVFSATQMDEYLVQSQGKRLPLDSWGMQILVAAVNDIAYRKTRAPLLKSFLMQLYGAQPSFVREMIRLHPELSKLEGRPMVCVDSDSMAKTYQEAFRKIEAPLSRMDLEAGQWDVGPFMPYIWLAEYANQDIETGVRDISTYLSRRVRKEPNLAKLPYNGVRELTEKHVKYKFLRTASSEVSDVASFPGEDGVLISSKKHSFQTQNIKASKWVDYPEFGLSYATLKVKDKDKQGFLRWKLHGKSFQATLSALAQSQQKELNDDEVNSFLRDDLACHFVNQKADIVSSAPLEQRRREVLSKLERTRQIATADELISACSGLKSVLEEDKCSSVEFFGNSGLSCTIEGLLDITSGRQLAATTELRKCIQEITPAGAPVIFSICAGSFGQEKSMSQVANDFHRRVIAPASGSQSKGWRAQATGGVWRSIKPGQSLSVEIAEVDE